MASKQKRLLCLGLSLALVSQTSWSQSTAGFADSIRVAYRLPELNYAVLSSENILEIQSLGYKKANSTVAASLSDKFRIGSNTKTVTSYIAALLVKANKLSWYTPFFDLYPELKAGSNRAYYSLTLQDLVTFRANVNSWTYTSRRPSERKISGTEAEQRYRFARWILQQKPPAKKQTVYRSNPSYILAGLLLERATGKTYEQLVTLLGDSLQIKFGFGQPNYQDVNQTWGHSETLKPEEPSNNIRLNWLLAAGNINVSLPDYTKFIQLHLRGLLGKSTILTASEFNYLHYGLPNFAFGWEWYVDPQDSYVYSFHRGSPGTFLTKVYICKDTDRAYIFFTNIQSAEAEQGLTVLFEKLRQVYTR